MPILLRYQRRLASEAGPMCRSLTIRWSSRGGPPPYRGQSYGLAAPQFSSGVRET
jgi:hypothetical protein